MSHRTRTYLFGVAAAASLAVWASALAVTAPASAATGDVTTAAGSGTNGFADGPATSAQFNNPLGVALDGTGNAYIADTSNDRIRKVDSAGNVTTVAGTGTYGFADGPATSAQFRTPAGVAVDGTGNVYVADAGNNRIRMIDLSGNVSTVAGTGTNGFADGPATTAQFDYPNGVAVDGTGNVYVAELGGRIRKIDLSGNVTTLAGTGTQGFADGPATTAQFSSPTGVAVDTTGNVYVADTGNSRVRKIDSSGNVSTVAGTGTQGFADGPATTAQFSSPRGVAFDAIGNVYVADTGNSRVRKIDSSGNVITLAGTGTSGFADGPATTAQFDSPAGVTFDGTGNIYVADMANNRIRKVDTVVVPPSTTTASTSTSTSTTTSTTTVAPFPPADQAAVLPPFIVPPAPTNTTAATTTVNETTTIAPTGSATPSTPTVPPVKVTLATSIVNTGDSVTVTGTNYLPGSTVTIELHSDPVALGTAKVSINGTFTFTGPLPLGVVGQHRIVVLGTASDNTSITSDAPLTISTPAATVNDLALTGTPATALALYALALITLGLAIRARARSLSKN